MAPLASEGIAVSYRTALWLVLGALLLPTIARAEGGITVVSSSHENRYPTNLLFRLQARSEAVIERVTLYYARGDTELTIFRQPPFDPAREVSLEYRLELNELNYLPPSVELRYWWRIEDAAGQQLETTPVRFTLEDTRFTWRRLERNDITVFWYRGTEQIGQNVMAIAENTLQRLASRVGLRQEGPVHIVVYANPQEMSAVEPSRSETYQSQITTLGMALSGQVLITMADQETIAHELTHVILHHFIGPQYLYDSIPFWLNEGLAVYMQSSPGAEYRSAITVAILRGSVPSLRRWNSPPRRAEDVSVAYGQAWSVVNFMIEKLGRERFMEFLAQFREGTRVEDAIERVYGMTIDGLDNAWRESAGLKAQPEPTVAPTRPQAQPTAAPAQEPQPAPTTEAGSRQLLVLLGGTLILVLLGAIGLVAALLVARSRL